MLFCFPYFNVLTMIWNNSMLGDNRVTIGKLNYFHLPIKSHISLTLNWNTHLLLWHIEGKKFVWSRIILKSRIPLHETCKGISTSLESTYSWNMHMTPIYRFCTIIQISCTKRTKFHASIQAQWNLTLTYIIHKKLPITSWWISTHYFLGQTSLHFARFY